MRSSHLSRHWWCCSESQIGLVAIDRLPYPVAILLQETNKQRNGSSLALLDGKCRMLGSMEIGAITQSDTR